MSDKMDLSLDEIVKAARKNKSISKKPIKKPVNKNNGPKPKGNKPILNNKQGNLTVTKFKKSVTNTQPGSDLRRKLQAVQSAKGADLRMTLDAKSDLRKRLAPVNKQSHPSLKPKNIQSTKPIKPVKQVTDSKINFFPGTVVKMENLVAGASTKDIKHILSQYGDVINVEHNASSGIAFITFKNKLDAQRCVDKLNGQVADGKVLKLSISVPQLQIKGSYNGNNNNNIDKNNNNAGPSNNYNNSRNFSDDRRPSPQGRYMGGRKPYRR